MNYLNKFGNIVSKGLSNFKGQLLTTKTDDYVNK